MASFRGTPEEFHKFIGPRIRNVIQARTKRHKRLLAACQECGKQGELEAAHVAGRQRKSVIEVVLAKPAGEAEVVIPDLAQVEAAILRAHEPFDQHFRFLCRECHVRYDAVHV